MKSRGPRIAAAGIAFVTPDDCVLLLKRAAPGDHAGEWCFPAGKIERGESAEGAALREAREETGAASFFEHGPMRLVNRGISADGVDFTTFAQAVSEPFDVELDHEHTDHRWARRSNLPIPLHPGVKAVLGRIRMDGAGPSFLAFDEGSVRSYDRDGRLVVELSNISKASVNPYRGNEIPNWQALGLVGDKIYQLLRDPEELEKAADTFNDLPILSKHVHVTAEKPAKELVIGSTRTLAEWAPPFMRNGLKIWDGDAIKLIESDKKKQISSAYHFRAEMTPGVFEGKAYDGVMRNIVGNHVAIVETGRAGPDVVVGDSMENVMAKKNTILSRKGAMAAGALMVFLQPRLAMDATLDLTPALTGITSKNFAAKKKKLLETVTKLTDGKLAQDASIEGLVELLDAVGEAKTAEAVDELDPGVAAVAENDDPAAGEVQDDDPMAKVKAFLAGKLSDEDMAELEALVSGGAEVTGDDPPPFAGKPDKGAVAKPVMAKDVEAVVKKETKDMVTKPAMDAAIKTAVDTALGNAAENQTQIREAERAVRPYVGDLAIACDSAEAVYRTALEAMGVSDVDGLHADALPHVLKAQPLPKKAGAREQVVAMDSAQLTDFQKRFPNVSRIGHA